MRGAPLKQNVTVKRRKLLWAAILALGLLATASALGFGWVTVLLLRDPKKDTSSSAIFGYITGFAGMPGFLILFWSGIAWLRQRRIPADPIAKLRNDVIADLNARMNRLRLGREDISLAYSSHGTTVDLNAATAPERFNHRVVIVGRPGSGKTYSAIQFANSVLRANERLIPIVVPLSRWDGSMAWQEWLEELISIDYNLSRHSTRELLTNGRLIPVVDGLDEAELFRGAQEFESLLRQILGARVLDRPTPLFITCRSQTWTRVQPLVVGDQTITVYRIREVGPEEARDFTRRSMGWTQKEADDFVSRLAAGGQSQAVRSPWRLSVACAVAESSGKDAAISAVNQGSLLDRFVELTLANATVGRLGRFRNSLDAKWLSAYAEYLTENRDGVYIDGRLLETRDLQLHRLWPAAGHLAPRIVDLVIAAVLSLPGIAWGISYLWERGAIARVGILSAVTLWSALLVRTSLKPWVAAATQDLSRLREGRFVARQTVLSALLAAATLPAFGLGVAAVVFTTAWVAVGLTVGFGQSLATDGEVRVMGPEGILRRERRISRSAAWTLLPLLALAFTQTWGLWWGCGLAVAYCAIVGETVACALWRRYLAMVLASCLRLSPTPRLTLRRMHALGFMRVAGVSYQFRHDELLAYFAARRLSHSRGQIVSSAQGQA